MDNSPSETWQTKVARKQLAVKAAIPSEWLLPSTVVISSNVLKIPRQCGILSEKELEITESYDAKHLLKMLSTGALSSAEVTAAFCKRAAIAQQLVNFSAFPILFKTELMRNARHRALQRPCSTTPKKELPF